MNNIKGPAIFLAQFVGEDAPFNSLDNICKWASSLGYKGVQIPSWDNRLIDLKKASESKDYCDEIKGATFADGIGSAVSGFFGALPNTSFSQNVGLVSMTGVMSRHVVTIGAILLIVAGLIPKVGAIISTIPIEVLGGGVIVMFGMVSAAGVSLLSGVNWNRRNLMIFAISLSVGLGLQLEPGALQHLSGTVKVLMTSGLLPAAALAIILNLVLPETVE